MKTIDGRRSHSLRGERIASILQVVYLAAGRPHAAHLQAPPFPLGSVLGDGRNAVPRDARGKGREGSSDAFGDL